jgi:pyrophosphatase PpaX
MTTRPLAVLFDLDGTLIDTIDLLLACARHTFEGRTPAPTDDEWIAGIGTPLRKQFAAYTSSDEEIEALTQRYRAYQREHHDHLTTAFPGVLETLDELERRGHPMGIVTSKSLGYSPDEAMFVGDSPHDIASGNAAGVISVAAMWGPFTREQLEPYHPAYYLDRITDLPALIDRLERP